MKFGLARNLSRCAKYVQMFQLVTTSWAYFRQMIWNVAPSTPFVKIFLPCSQKDSRNKPSVTPQRVQVPPLLSCIYMGIFQPNGKETNCHIFVYRLRDVTFLVWTIGVDILGNSIADVCRSVPSVMSHKNIILMLSVLILERYYRNRNVAKII